MSLLTKQNVRRAWLCATKPRESSSRFTSNLSCVSTGRFLAAAIPPIRMDKIQFCDKSHTVLAETKVHVVDNVQKWCCCLLNFQHILECGSGPGPKPTNVHHLSANLWDSPIVSHPLQDTQQESGHSTPTSWIIPAETPGNVTPTARNKDSSQQCMKMHDKQGTTNEKHIAKTCLECWFDRQWRVAMFEKLTRVWHFLIIIKERTFGKFGIGMIGLCVLFGHLVKQITSRMLTVSRSGLDVAHLYSSPQ